MRRHDVGIVSPDWISLGFHTMYDDSGQLFGQTMAEVVAVLHRKRQVQYTCLAPYQHRMIHTPACLKDRTCIVRLRGGKCPRSLATLEGTMLRITTEPNRNSRTISLQPHTEYREYPFCCTTRLPDTNKHQHVPRYVLYYGGL